MKRPTEALVASLFLGSVIVLTSAAIAGQLNLTWLDPSGGSLGFSVERSAGVSDPFTVVGTTGSGGTAYADVTVADSTTYCYRVRAFNSIAYSDYSYPACGTMAPAALALALNINQPRLHVGDHTSSST